MNKTFLKDYLKIIAAKGSKDVHVIKGQEREKTIQVVACCNAEGSFLPAYCIFKRVGWTSSKSGQKICYPKQSKIG